jgi:hypothetical protein
MEMSGCLHTLVAMLLGILRHPLGRRLGGLYTLAVTIKILNLLGIEMLSSSQ